MPNNKDIEKHIENLERELRKLRLSVKEKTQEEESPKVKVGDRVRITNPSKGQPSEGEVIKVNLQTNRISVQTTNRKPISRNIKNIQVLR